MKRYSTIKTFVLLSFGLGCTFSSAQQNEIDSLLVLIAKDADINKIHHINVLSRLYVDIGSYDSAFNRANQALTLLNNSEGKSARKESSISYNNLGLAYTEQGDYPKALDNFFKALRISENLKEKKLIAIQLGNIGNAYTAYEDYPKALDYFMKAKQIGEALGDSNRVAIQLCNISNVYYYLGDLSKALEYDLKSLKMAEKLNNPTLVASINGNIGNVYKEMADSIGVSNSITDSLYKKALIYYFTSLELAEQVQSKYGMTIQFGNIGMLYLRENKYKEAEVYLLKSLRFAEEIGSLDDIKVGHQNLSTLYENANRADKAFAEYKLFIAARDSLFNEDKAKEITRKEMNYEFEKKEMAAKAEADKQAAVAASEKQRQRIVLVLVSCVLLLVLIFAGFIFRALRITRKQKEVIEHQKHLVEEKQKEILDSIHYARRIQTALLPTEKYIAKTLNRLNKN